jgi:hypothetical protein
MQLTAIPNPHTFENQWKVPISIEACRMDKPHLNGYAFKNAKLVHVSEVVRGLACDCTCVECRGALVAKKGTKRREHFAHAIDIDCLGAAETALHLVSKELISKLDCICLP